MSSLLSFSRYILIPVLTDWLTARDLTQLDSSLCNESERSVLEYLMKEYPKPFESVCLSLNNISPLYVKWMVSKGLEVNNVKLILNAKILDRIEQLTCVMFNQKEFARSFCCLNNITHLQICGLEAVQGIHEKVITWLLMCMPNLIYIELKHYCSVIEISKYCKKLQSIQVTYGGMLYPQFGLEIAQIIRSCPTLTDVSLSLRTSMHTGFCNFIDSLIVNGSTLTSLALPNPLSCRNYQCMLFMFQNPKIVAIKLPHFLGEKSFRTLLWYKGPQLTKLSLCEGNWRLVDIRDIGITCINLTELNLENIYPLEQVATILTSLKKLLSLRLKCSQTIPQIFFTSLSRCESLRNLTIMCYDTREYLYDIYETNELTHLTIFCTFKNIDLIEYLLQLSPRMLTLTLRTCMVRQLPDTFHLTNCHSLKEIIFIGYDTNDKVRNKFKNQGINVIFK